LSIFLSIIIPAHNEESRLPDTLEQVFHFLQKQSFDSEVLVVENGSTDDTFNVAQQFAAKHVQLALNLPPDLPVLSPDQDLAVYRVAQESLTNVARHARAGLAQVALEQEDGAVVLRVSDDGVGIPALHAEATDGGVGGMRERALLAGGRLRVRALPERGTEVRLDLWPSR